MHDARLKGSHMPKEHSKPAGQSDALLQLVMQRLNVHQQPLHREPSPHSMVPQLLLVPDGQTRALLEPHVCSALSDRHELPEGHEEPEHELQAFVSRTQTLFWQSSPKSQASLL